MSGASDEDISLQGIRNKVVNRFRSILLTTALVWRQPARLLSSDSAQFEPSSPDAAPTPPLKYFLLIIGLAGAIEASLYGSRQTLELPSPIAKLSAVFKFLPELTIISTASSVLISAAMPWLVYAIMRQRIPFKILIRAYSYQQGGIVAPFAICISVIVFLTSRNASWQPWIEYLPIALLPVSFFGAAWVWRQMEHEGYSKTPLRIGSFIALASLASASLLGVKPSMSYQQTSWAMYPTLSPKDVVLANKLIAWWRSPKRGELVIASNRQGPPIISRVVGLPGDTIQVRAGTVFLNSVPLQTDDGSLYRQTDNSAFCLAQVGMPECELRQLRETLPSGKSYHVIKIGYQPQLEDTEEFKLNSDEMFLLSDSRSQSADSRISVEQGGLGVIKLTQIAGIVYDRVLPVGAPKLDRVGQDE